MNKHTLFSLCAAVALMLPGTPSHAAKAEESPVSHTKRLPIAFQSHMVAQVQNAGTAVGRRQSVTNVLDIVHPAMQRPSRTLVNTTLKAHAAHFDKPEEWLDQTLETLGVPEMDVDTPLFYKAAKGTTVLTGKALTMAELMDTLNKDVEDVYMVLALQKNGLVYRLNTHDTKESNQKRVSQAPSKDAFTDATPFFHISSGKKEMVGAAGLLIADVLEITHKKRNVFVRLGNDQTLKALEFETPAAEITYMFGDTILCTLKPNMRPRAASSASPLKRSKSQKRVDPTASAMDDKPDAAATGNVTVRRRGSIFGGRSGGKGKKGNKGGKPKDPASK